MTSFKSQQTDAFLMFHLGNRVTHYTTVYLGMSHTLYNGLSGKDEGKREADPDEVEEEEESVYDGGHRLPLALRHQSVLRRGARPAPRRPAPRRPAPAV